MSANLWNGRADPARVAELAACEDVDILAVQELGTRQAEAIREVLPYGVLHPLDRSHHGMGIALRRPGRMDRLRLPYRDAHRARLDPREWQGLDSRLEILNVHIAAPHVAPYGSGFPRRRQQLRELERYLIYGDEGQEPECQGRHAGAQGFGAVAARAQVLIGDLNATPRWPLYRRLARHMTDAAIAAAQRRGRALKNTWGPRPSGPRWLRIDHGFVRGTDVYDFRVVPIAGSDHAALIIDLAPPPAAR